MSGSSIGLHKSPPGTSDAPPPHKTLVAIFVGRGSIGIVDANVRHLGFEHFSYVVFQFDDADLSHLSWWSRVVTVRAQRQMKWWFVKRFIAPAMMADYKYVLVVDDDCDLRGMDGAAFIADLDKYDVRIGQPAHAAESFQPQYPMLRQRSIATGDTDDIAGSWLNFIESGPLVAFSRSSWPCVWGLLQPDLGSGYGYDLVWAPACAEGRAAVLHGHAIQHLNEKSASRRPNFVGRSVGEAITFFRRIAPSGLHPETPVLLGHFTS